MRHYLTTRFVVVLAVLLVAAALLWAALARTVVDPAREARTETILELTGDVDRGRELYIDTPGRACASCHSFDALDVSVDGGPPIEALRPTEWETVASLVEGTVSAHEEYEYEHRLSNQQVADLAALLSEAVEQE